jgi:hypothetical protein
MPRGHGPAERSACRRGRRDLRPANNAGFALRSNFASTPPAFFSGLSMIGLPSTSLPSTSPACRRQARGKQDKSPDPQCGENKTDDEARTASSPLLKQQITVGQTFLSALSLSKGFPECLAKGLPSLGPAGSQAWPRTNPFWGDSSSAILLVGRTSSRDNM